VEDKIPGPDLRGRRVLIVEDEFFIADDIADALRGAGAEVVGPAPTCARAMAMMSDDASIDLAVLDVNLHDEPIYRVADLLAARGVPFLLASGYAQRDLPLRYRHLPHWEKPVDPSVLVSALSAMATRR